MDEWKKWEEDVNERVRKNAYRYIEKFTTQEFGPRCEEFEPECACCKAWRAFDIYKQACLD